MYTVRRDTSACSATSATVGEWPAASSLAAASTMARRVRRRWATRSVGGVLLGFFFAAMVSSGRLLTKIY
jgi:hypothetical protein